MRVLSGPAAGPTINQVGNRGLASLVFLVTAKCRTRTKTERGCRRGVNKTKLEQTETVGQGAIS